MMSQSQRISRAAARVLPAVLIAALAAPLAVAAPSDEGREEFTRAFQKTLPLKAGQRLSIEHRNGDIRVRTHAEPKAPVARGASGAPRRSIIAMMKAGSAAPVIIATRHGQSE